MHLPNVMGFFDFLRRKKPEPVIIEIAFNEIEPWLDAWLQKSVERSSKELLYIRESLLKLSNDLKTNLP